MSLPNPYEHPEYIRKAAAGWAPLFCTQHSTFLAIPATDDVLSVLGPRADRSICIRAFLSSSDKRDFEIHLACLHRNIPDENKRKAWRLLQRYKWKTLKKAHEWKVRSGKDV